MENFKNLPIIKKLGFNRIVLVGVLILMYFVFSLGSGRMLGSGDINNALNMVDYLGFLALGVTFVIATGGIDFSIGPVMVCAGLIGGRLLVTFGWPLWLALVMCVIVGMVFGVFNGILVAYMGLPSFISSMASMMLAKGVGSVFTHVQNSNWPASGEPNSWYKYFVNYNGFPTGLLFLLVVAIICAIIMNKTKIGRYILCIGSNTCESTFLYVGFMQSLPAEIEEAAYIDGASTARTFYEIVMPLITPILATALIKEALWIWNDFMLPMLILTKNEYFTLSLYAYNFKSIDQTDFGALFACYILQMLPMLVFYLFAQKHIIGGLTAGSVKG